MLSMREAHKYAAFVPGQLGSSRTVTVYDRSIFALDVQQIAVF